MTKMPDKTFQTQSRTYLSKSGTGGGGGGGGYANQV